MARGRKIFFLATGAGKTGYDAAQEHADGNDTVPFSVWCGGRMRSTNLPSGVALVACRILCAKVVE